MLLLIPFPQNCDTGVVTRFGVIRCTKSTSPKLLQSYTVVDTCTAEGFYHKNNNCNACPEGCTTCSERRIGGSMKVTCSVCNTKFGYEQSTNSEGVGVCTNTKCVGELNKYWKQDTSECVECATDCEQCLNDKCIVCKAGKVLKIDSTTHSCVPKTDCGAGFYFSDFNTCSPCEATCSTCTGPTADDCLSCKTGDLFSLRLVKISKHNLDAELDNEEAPTIETIVYEVDPNAKYSGKCINDCSTIEGYALYAKSNVCTLCSVKGCTKCDTNGVCTKCDQSRGLSLITDPADNEKKICSP